MKRLPTIVSLLGMVTAAGFPAHAQDPVSHGQALVAEFCGRCHAVGTRGKSRHPDAPPFRTFGRKIDLDEFPRALAEFRQVTPTCQISSSVRKMPARCAPICA